MMKKFKIFTPLVYLTNTFIIEPNRKIEQEYLETERLRLELERSTIRNETTNKISKSIKEDSFEEDLFEDKYKNILESMLGDHIKDLEPSLTLIKNLNRIMRDGKNHGCLFKESLVTLTNKTDENTYNFFSKMASERGALFDLTSYYTNYVPNKESCDLFSNINKQYRMSKKFYSIMNSDFTDVIRKLQYDNADLIGLKNFLVHRESLANDALRAGKVASKNIENLPEFPEMVNRVSLLFENLSFSDLHTIYVTFANTGDTLIQQAVLHPHLVSVLGNILFFKALIPLASSYYHMSYNNKITTTYLNKTIITTTDYEKNKITPSNWQKLINKSLKQAALNKSKQAILNKSKHLVNQEITSRNLLMIATSGFSLSSVFQSWWWNSSVIESEVPGIEESSQVKARTLVDRIQDPNRLEGAPGELAERTRDTLSRTSAEIGMTIGRVYRSFSQGVISENRPAAEFAADMVDKAVDNSKKEDTRK